MALDKVALTLYDLLGYLLPGYVWLLAASLLEATFGRTSLFSFEAMAGNPLTFSLVAYFLGHLSHALGSLLRARWRRYFSDEKHRLCPQTQQAVKLHLMQAYSLSEEDCCRLNHLDTYLLTDAYVMASGVATDREVLMAREGFHCGAMVAFAGLALTLLAALVQGEASAQLSTGTVTGLGMGPTLFLLGLAVAATLIFRQRYAFHARVKANTASLLFLALHTKDVQRGKE